MVGPLAIREANISFYEPYLRQCRREGVYPQNDTEVFAATRDGVVVGLGGIAQHAPKYGAMLRGDFVPPEYRGQGIWSELFDYRMAVLADRRVALVYAMTTPIITDAYLRRGATIIRRYKHMTLVRLEVPVHVR